MTHLRVNELGEMNGSVGSSKPHATETSLLIQRAFWPREGKHWQMADNAPNTRDVTRNGYSYSFVPIKKVIDEFSTDCDLSDPSWDEFIVLKIENLLLHPHFEPAVHHCTPWTSMNPCVCVCVPEVIVLSLADSIHMQLICNRALSWRVMFCFKAAGDATVFVHCSKTHCWRLRLMAGFTHTMNFRIEIRAWDNCCGWRQLQLSQCKVEVFWGTRCLGGFKHLGLQPHPGLDLFKNGEAFRVNVLLFIK